jgi:exodeoxyribonuclease VII large subunit
LSDYTADVHCHTPTAAAEYIIRGYKNISLQLESYFKELAVKTKNELKYIEASLNTYQYILKTYNPNNVIMMLRNQCDIQKTKLLNNINNELSRKQNSLNLMHEKVLSHDYRKQLKNGYSLIFNKDNKLIKDIDNVNTGEKIKIMFDKFSIQAEVTNILHDKEDIQGA